MKKEDILKALGPLAELYEDPAINEILVDAPDRVYVQRQGQERLEDSAVKFVSTEAIRMVIDSVMALGGVTLSDQQTTGHVRLSDKARAFAVIPPTAVNGTYLVIRKFAAEQLDREKLIEFGFVTEEGYEFLQSAIAARVNILISGDTASGKTTFTNILTDDFPEDERVIVVEPVLDMQVRHPRVVRLAADSSPDLTYSELIEAASQMRPDRLVFLTDTPGPDAVAILELIARGHDGSMMDIHATSPEDALARLESNCLMANLGLGLPQIRNLIASTIQLITHQVKMPNVTKRRIMQITELRGLENDRYVLQPLFRYDPDEDKLVPTGVKPSWVQR